MRLAGAVLLALMIAFCLSPAPSAQGTDRAVERISTALQRQSAFVSSLGPWIDPPPKKLGILTVRTPMGTGEMVRLSLPIGELISRAVQGTSAANHRRRETSARQDVQKALNTFTAQLKRP
jgi:hypothetical protein